MDMMKRRLKSSASVWRNHAIGERMTQKQMTIDFPVAHRDDPITSYEAAEKMIKSGALSQQENQVYTWIVSYLKVNQKKDFTAKEVVWWRYANKYHIIERRLSGLHRKSKIERTGEKRDGCCVWRLARS